MTEPSLWDYARAAFFARRRVKGLGGVPFNALGVLAVAVAGLLNPGIWLIGGGLELAYLTWLSHNERFRTLVRGERLRRSARSLDEQLESMVAGLSTESQARWRRLRQRCGQIRERAAAAAPALGGIDGASEAGLNSLLTIHARLLASREALRGYMAEGTRQELERKVEAAAQRLAAATSDAVKRSVESSLEILKKRVEHARQAGEHLQVVEAELDRIENQVDLIAEDLAVSGDPTVLSARIDAVTSTLTEANRFLQANELLVGALGADAAPPATTPAAPAVRLGKGG
jgi:hypothetical protein